MSTARLMQMGAAGVEYHNPAWTLYKASYSGNSFDVSGQTGTASDVSFKPDGTKMYILGNSESDINEYSLSTAWDISTASYVQNFNVSTEETASFGLSFKPDGTKMYIIGSIGDAVYEYTLSTAWDISTASYVQNFSVSENFPYGLFFKPDGTKMYITGAAVGSVYEYNLSSAWDISSSSLVQSFSIASQETTPFNLFFKTDGTKMYVIGSVSDSIHEYSLSSAWDISTASYVQNFSVASEETSPRGLFFRDNGTEMYIVGTVTDTVYEYNLT